MGTQRSLTGMPIINLRNKLTRSVTPTPGLHGPPTINEGEVFHDPQLSIPNSHNSDSSSSSSSSYVHLTDDNDSDSSDDGLDARNFRKGVKRDISMYSNFKDDKQWYAWYRDTLATARVHGTHQVFDPSYYPKTRKESALWQEIQQFMYSVFCRVLQTASGRMMVKRHEERADAQAIATALCEHYERSIVAQTNVQDVRAGLAQLRIKDWKSSKQAFLNHWESQWMIVDRCTAHADRESDAVRKTMLYTALRDEPEFISLQHQDNIFKAQDSPITYDNYLALLRSTAFNIDSRHTGKPRRQANTANQTSSSSSSHNKGGHGKGGASHGSRGGGIPTQIEFQSRKKSGVNYLPKLDRLSSLRTSPNIRLTLVNKKTQARYPRHYGTNFLPMQERLLLLLTRAIGLVIKAVRQLLKVVHLSLKLPRQLHHQVRRPSSRSRLVKPATRHSLTTSYPTLDLITASESSAVPARSINACREVAPHGA